MKIHSRVRVVLCVLTDRFDRCYVEPKTHLEIPEALTDLVLWQHSFLRFRWLLKFFCSFVIFCIFSWQTARNLQIPWPLNTYAKFCRNKILGSHVTAKDIGSAFNSECNLILLKKLYRILHSIFHFLLQVSKICNIIQFSLCLYDEVNW